MGKFSVTAHVSTHNHDLFKISLRYSVNDGKLYQKIDENSDLPVIASAAYFTKHMEEKLSLSGATIKYFYCDDFKIITSINNLSQNELVDALKRLQWIALNSRFVRNNLTLKGPIPLQVLDAPA